MKYAWIEGHKKHWLVSLPCDVLGVSTSGFFESMRRKGTEQPSKPGASRRIMQEHGIKARRKRKFVVTTDSKHKLPIAANLLQPNFTAAAPNQVWTGDITYTATDEGWLYLAVPGCTWL